MLTKLITLLSPKKKVHNQVNNTIVTTMQTPATSSGSIKNVSITTGAVTYSCATGSYTTTTGALGTVTTTGYGGGGGGWTTGVTTSVNAGTISIGSTHLSGSDSDITLKRGGKPDIKIGATLDLICECLNIVIPEKSLLDNNPALKLSYENYKEVLQRTVSNPELKQAYNDYKFIENLVREEKE